MNDDKVMNEEQLTFNAKVNSLSGGDLVIRKQLARKIFCEQVRISRNMLSMINAMIIGMNFPDVSNLEKWKTELSPSLAVKDNLDMNFLINASNSWLLQAFDSQDTYASFIDKLAAKLEIVISAKSLVKEYHPGFSRGDFITTFLHNPLITFIFMLHLGGLLSKEEQHQVLANSEKSAS